MATDCDRNARMRRTDEIHAEQEAHVLLFLAGGERSGSEVRDDLAVWCGGKDGASRARVRLICGGLAVETRKVGPDRFYRLTEAGEKRADEVRAAKRAERRAA